MIKIKVLKETEYRITADRAKEFLNMVIGHVSVGNNCHETLKELPKIGFTGEELFNEFSFNLLDVADAEDDVDTEQKEEKKNGRHNQFRNYYLSGRAGTASWWESRRKSRDHGPVAAGRPCPRGHRR